MAKTKSKSDLSNINNNASKENKERAIEAAITAIERSFGKGAIMKYGDTELPQIESISTGSIGLDIALGVGGVPRGRVVEIFGAESSGKTTLSLHLIAEAQKAGGVAAFVDAEHALDINYAGKLGVQVDELLIAQPDTGEQALEIVETLVRSGAVSIVVVDSVAALVPKAELQGDIGDHQVGSQARLMSKALRMLTGSIHKSDCVVVFINQIRMKIGVMFGSPKTTSGGQALKFYASQRLEVARIGSVKQGEEVIGNRTKVKVVKNKVAPPFRQVEFDIYYGEGIGATAEIIDMAVEEDLIQKSGAWYSMDGERLGQGKERVRQLLKENDELREDLRLKVRAAKGLDGADVSASENVAELPN